MKSQIQIILFLKGKENKKIENIYISKYYL